MHNRWHVLKRLPNLARVSVSPWADEAFMAEALGSRYVYSRKPSPASLAWDVFGDEAVRRDLQDTKDTCERHGCPLEIILKDISTVRYDPQRLSRWSEIAMEVAGPAELAHARLYPLLAKSIPAWRPSFKKKSVNRAGIIFR